MSKIYQDKSSTGDVRCPECMEYVFQDELDTFNGLCETCNES